MDQVYLPAAIGARGNRTPQNTYLGSTQALAPFRSALRAFTATGTLWPFYVPAYFTAQNPTIPLPNPPAGGKPYPQPQLPSTNTVYAKSFRNPPPAPPVLSSDTLSGIGVLGQAGQATLDLWNKCTSTTPTQSPTCTKIRQVNTFFVNDYRQCFPGKALPSTEEFLRDVYGWVQFPGCSTPLAQVAGYNAAIRTYCDLQYNFFDTAVLPADVFNPYVKLIHETLASNAYAFSIDDAVAFKSLPGDGVIITIAGADGLENRTQTPLPTASDLQDLLQGERRLRRVARRGFPGVAAELVPDLRPSRRPAGLGDRQGAVGGWPVGKGRFRQPWHRRGRHPQRPAEHRAGQADCRDLAGWRLSASFDRPWR